MLDAFIAANRAEYRAKQAGRSPLDDAPARKAASHAALLASQSLCAQTASSTPDQSPHHLSAGIIGRSQGAAATCGGKKERDAPRSTAVGTRRGVTR